MPKDAEACRHHSRTAGCRGGRERIAKEEARLARSGWAWVLRALHFELPQTVQVATTSCLKVALHISMAVPQTLLLKMDLISILSESDRIEIQVRFQDKCCPSWAPPGLHQRLQPTTHPHEAVNYSEDAS